MKCVAWLGKGDVKSLTWSIVSIKLLRCGGNTLRKEQNMMTSKAVIKFQWYKGILDILLIINSTAIYRLCKDTVLL
jgi:hypothetical protein